jgi:hypothetical protein
MSHVTPEYNRPQEGEEPEEPDNPTPSEWTADTVTDMGGTNDWQVANEIATAHNAALAAEREAVEDWKAELQEQARETVRVAEKLAAEREKFAAAQAELAAGELIAQRLFRVVEQLPDVKHNSPNFKTTIEELQAACKAMPVVALDAYVAEQLAAEKNLRADWNYVIEELEQQLAAERRKVQTLRDELTIIAPRARYLAECINAALAKVEPPPLHTKD